MTTMYVVGQQQQADGLFAGNLTVVNLAATTSATITAIPRFRSAMARRAHSAA